ncbi:MAG: hypothetical protein H3Z54_09505 [archaeon]|nr:hypothetical protein [archaeon]
MSEKKDPIPVYVGEKEVGTAEIPTPIWAYVGAIVGIIAIVIAVVAWFWRR